MAVLAGGEDIWVAVIAGGEDIWMSVLGGGEDIWVAVREPEKIKYLCALLLFSDFALSYRSKETYDLLQTRRQSDMFS